MSSLVGPRSQPWFRRYFRCCRVGELLCAFARRVSQTKVQRLVPRKRVRNKPGSAQGSASTENIGPETLDRFERICQNFQESAALQAQINDRKETIMYRQGFRDHVMCDLLQLGDNTDIEPAVHVEKGEPLITKLEDEKAVDLADIETWQARKTLLESSNDELWTEFSRIAKIYFNGCLAADFEATWSLDEADCRWLKQFVNLRQLILDTQIGIRDAVVKKSGVRNGHWKANKENEAAPERLDANLSQQLNAARLERFAAELQTVETDLRSQKDLLQLRRDYYHDNVTEICNTVLIPLLQRAGRFAREAAEPSAAISTANEDRDAITPDDSSPHPIDEAEEPLEGNSPEQNSGDAFDHGNASAEELQGQYTRVQARLHVIHQDYSDKIDSLRDQELDHLLTFTDSSRRTFEAFIERELRPEAKEIGLVEEDLAMLRRRLIRSGNEIPRSPVESLHSVKGGGISKRTRTSNNTSRSSKSKSSSSSPRRRKLRERHNKYMTNWRFGADEALVNPDKIDPSPGKSVADSERLQLSRSPSRSPSRVPDREFDNYIEDHKRQHHKNQAELRREKGKRRAS